MFNKIKKITHEHGVSIGILLVSGILDLSFALEKYLVYKNIDVSPLTWAIIFGSLGLITLIGAVVEYTHDLKSDCKGEEND